MKTLFVALAALFFSMSVHAKLVRYCQVSYKTSQGWSQTKVLEILFLTGKELIAKTKEDSYKTDAIYCVILNGKNNENGDDVVELKDPLLAVGDSFDEEDFLNAYRFKTQLEGVQALENQTISWKIIGKEDDQFIHAIEEKNNRKKYTNKIASRNTAEQPNSSTANKEVIKPQEEQ